MPGRTARADVAKRVHIIIADGPHPVPQVNGWPEQPEAMRLIEEHLHVGHDILGQTNEAAGEWIKTIIARVVDKQLQEET